MNTKFNSRIELERMIMKRGGYVNSHCHLDRADTLSKEQFLRLPTLTLKDKWSIVDDIKKNSTIKDIYNRMAYRINHQLEKRVTAICSFIDVDPVIQDKAIMAAQLIRDEFGDDLKISFANQTLKGVVTKEAYKWFEMGADFCDIVGGLPKVDGAESYEHMLIVLDTARQKGKLAHIHVDQFNTASEDETSSLIEAVKETQMQGKVHAIHCISVAAKTKEKRVQIYKDLEDNKIGVIACPTAWIDSPRNEECSPIHNSVTPIDEMILYDINVSLGSDNIYDAMKPFSNGDMWTETRLLLESCRVYDIEAVSKIASVNGKKALGVPVWQ
jgi:cytosine/adenosine deaminase-related metal-dependent hydrolase